MARARHPYPGRTAGAALIVCALLLAVPPPLRAVEPDLDAQIQEIRSLVREKRYPLALESLRFVAREIQDLRIRELAPFFPDPPNGWTAASPISLLDESEVWSDRIDARRSYHQESGGAKIDLTIDLHSPLVPAVTLSLNPLFIAADPQTRLVDIGTEKAGLHYNPDTGEGELRLVVGRETLVTLLGRGIRSADLLTDLARRMDLPALRARGGR